MKRVRWGIVSTGRIAHQFVQDFRFVKNADVVAVASRAQSSADAFAAQYSIPRAYSGYEDLYRDPGIDAVYVATPHSLHFTHTAGAITSGKAVLCEKPFTISSREAEQLFELAEASRVLVMEAMWTYFLPAIRKAQDWVAEGRIGRIRHIKADFGYPLLPFDAHRREYDADLAGGVLLEMGIYPIALAWLFLQRDPDRIDVVARFAPNGVEDDVVMLFDYGGNDDGCVATLATSFRSKLRNWAYIVGEEGYIAIPDFWRAGECMLFHLDEQIEHYRDGRASLGFNFETNAFNQALLRGQLQCEDMPWSNTLKFQQHMERVRERFRT